MQVYALDKQFQLVVFSVPYTNLQWNRKYFGVGDFQIEIPAALVPDVNNWEYLVNSERPEIGLVQKVEYKNDAGEVTYLISGMFAEAKLNQLVAIPRFECDLPTTEAVMQKMFEQYNVLKEKNVEFIWNETRLGSRTQCDFLGDPLADKLYSICQTQDLSWRVTLDEPQNDFFSARMWQGVDRTYNQDRNTRAIFAANLGNTQGEAVMFDSSAKANICRVYADDGKITFDVDLSKQGEERFETFLDATTKHPKKDQPVADFKAELRQEALEKLVDLKSIVEVDVTAIGTGYLVDYDLGDLVTVILENGIEFDTRIVEVREVMKPEGHTVELGFGTKRISNIERAVKHL